MTELGFVFARIAARYATGALATYGVLADEGEIYMVIAALIGALIEGAYAFAKRKGWAT
jgi:hypothetical protein